VASNSAFLYIDVVLPDMGFDRGEFGFLTPWMFCCGDTNDSCMSQNRLNMIARLQSFSIDIVIYSAGNGRNMVWKIEATCYDRDGEQEKQKRVCRVSNRRSEHRMAY
jgi:hypothetical protein